MGSFHRVFRSIASATLACSAAAACGGTDDGATGTGGAGTDTSGFTEVDCMDDALLRAVTPSSAVDSLELRSARDQHVIARTGTPCATAKDAAKCKSAYDTTKSDAGWSVTLSCVSACSVDSQYVLATRGDSVIVITDRNELARFLASIETPADAALLARVDGRRDCPYFRRAGDAFELLYFEGGGCQNRTRTLVRIDATGVSSVVGSSVIEKGNGECPVARCPPAIRREIARAFADRDDRTVEDVLATYFERAMRLEAASVAEFERIAHELESLGAPTSLARAARRAARDEVRHARAMETLARKFGAHAPGADREVRRRTSSYPPPRIATTFAARARSLEDFAVENMVEGCVRESFGALVATYQGMNAQTSEIALAMRSVAHDEARHAALSHAIARWAGARLDRAAKKRVEDARVAAIEELRAEMLEQPAPALVAKAGVPTSDQAARLLESFVERVRAA